MDSMPSLLEWGSRSSGIATSTLRAGIGIARRIPLEGFARRVRVDPPVFFVAIDDPDTGMD
jgi:hypothetical protein